MILTLVHVIVTVAKPELISNKWEKMQQPAILALSLIPVIFLICSTDNMIYDHIWQHVDHNESQSCLTLPNKAEKINFKIRTFLNTCL